MVIFDSCPTRPPGLPRAGGSSGGGQGRAASPPRASGLSPVTRAATCDLPARPQGWAHIWGRGSPWPGPLGHDHPHKAEVHGAEGRLWVGAACPHLHLVNPRLGGDKDESGPSRPCRLSRHLTKLKALWSPLPGSSPQSPPTGMTPPMGTSAGPGSGRWGWEAERA